MRLSCFALLLGISSCLLSQEAPETGVKNIILMIGDGMGMDHVFAAYTASHGNLNLMKSSFTGFSKTSSANNYTTDSGAGATAISGGQKTANYSIGVDVSGNPLKSILISAEENGLSTGLVATSSITHATPAAFIASVRNRSDEVEIAAGFIGSGIDIFIGGGRKYFENEKINVSDSLRKQGYSIVYSLEDIGTEGNGNIGCLVAPEALPPKHKGRDDYLPKATEAALEKLSKNDKGFFLMVEGSQIDWGGHANDIDYVISEVIDFDKAVGKAFEFADKNPGTLVIVTADHETGGLAITEGDIKAGSVKPDFTSKNHTPVFVPVYTYGEGADNFSGIYENAEIYHKMMKAFGF